MPSNLLNPFDLERSPLEVAPESGLEDYEDQDDDQFLADADTLERLTVGGFRVSSVVRAAGFEELIPDPRFMPKALTKLIMTELKKAKLKGMSLVKDSVATQPRGGWEYGILIQLYLTPDPARVPEHSQGRHECTIKINGAETRANGIATLEFPDGAEHVMATKGGDDPVAVAKMLASEIVHHFLAARDD
jgi:hypothetical protein